MKYNLIQDKSYRFSLEIIKTYKVLVFKEKEFILSKQLLRSGTSIGANIEEAIGAQSTRDFYAKLSISYKEARETRYWIRLMRDSNQLNSETAKKLIEDCDELLKITGSIRKTLQSKL
jgi:four helix bundle protein